MANIVKIDNVTPNSVLSSNSTSPFTITKINGTKFVQNMDNVVLGGNFTKVNSDLTTRITRLNPDGSVDSSFNTTGTNSTVAAIIEQPDGKILIGGSFTTYNGISCNRLVRINSNGNIDSTFNIGTGFASNVSTIALQSDGKIIVGGTFTLFNGNSAAYIVRLNSNGSIDTSFNMSTGGFNNFVNTIQIQSDGSILAGGNFTSYKGTTVNRIARLLTNATLDTGFSIGTGFDNSINANSMLIQSDGTIIIGGAFSTYNGVTANRIISLNPDGSINSSFNSGTGFNSSVNGIAIQYDGTIFAGGNFTTYNGSTANRVIQLASDGTYINYLNSGVDAAPVTIITDSNTGNVFWGGNFSSYQGSSYNRLVKTDAFGNIDYSFNVGTGFDNTIYILALQSDGKLLVGGSFLFYKGFSCNRFSAFNQDNTINPYFGSYMGTGFNNTVYSTCVQSDGNILVGGAFVTYNGTTATRIARLNTYAQLDPSFNTGTGFNGQINYLDKDSSGKIYIGGSYTTYKGVATNRIVKLNSDGSPDSSFSIGTGFNNIVNCLLIDEPSSNLFVGGGFTTYKGITNVRLAKIDITNGSPITFTIGAGFNNSVLSLALQPDGKLLAAGSFTTYNGTSILRLARLNIDGTLDSSFNPSINNQINSIALQSDGKIVIGGTFTVVNGVSRMYLARINPDASLDTSFKPYPNINGQIYSVKLQSNGKILVGGAFNSPYYYITRINTNGSYDPGFPITSVQSIVYTIFNYT